MNLLLTSKMSSRLREKVYRYALFYFPESNQLGTARTSIVAEGFRCRIKVDEVVMVRWQDEKRLVPAKIMQMDGMYLLIFFSLAPVKSDSIDMKLVCK